MASVAAIVAIKPLVSMRPSASWLLLLRVLLAMEIPSFFGWGLADAGGLGLLAGHGQDSTEVLVRPRDDLHADDLADAAGGGGAGVHRGLHRGHVAQHQRRHQT